MLTIDTLRDFGADVDTGLGRCMNNEAFYLRLVKLALADGNFDKLAANLAAGDLQGAFESAHALKGALGNLALSPLFDPASELTELLRSRTEGDYAALADRIAEQRARLAELAAE